MITFTVTDDAGQSTEVKATARDVLNWEKTTKGAKFGHLADGMELGHLYKIAWFAAKRTAVFTGSLAEFEAGYDVVPEEDDDSDPTNEGR
ncbi:hypothetical protein [Amycolatopsis sp. H20-H5]|uniref:hypothetical protein n=1 Tax=Amycolatopsis sp. H20-H5 TaxID=3046309 RepID=UPI002DBD4356|nr:hypothetical protein [Amycolatopsis sp. H20-H5]MEC3975087.1 hypothetical protein [Amycolatopsis sp. H20-H5]